MAGLTTFTLASFDRARVPGLLATVPLERLRMRRLAGLAWGRHLGTAAGGRTLGADPARWAWFCRWDDEDGAAAFHDDLEARLRPREVTTLHLRAVRARGRWAGHEVTVDPVGRESAAPAPLVVLTRARVRPTRWRPFRGSVPPVDAALARAPGLLRSVGIGEWPVLVQGTLSLWRDGAAMADFARGEAHRVVVRRTADERWYAEELFARFSVERAQGDWDGAPPV
ncbi:MAG: hypothetical protein ABIS47_01990 [Acidimicrobiales bacterium]